MQCPFCRAPDTRVVDSRLVEEGTQVKRRRECERCGQRFTTFEQVEVSYPRLIKRDGSRELFSESKLRKGLENALFKRPVASESIDHAVRGILGKVRAHPEREIASRQVGEWVMDALARLDRVGYVRFASIYRSFDDVQAFRDEIDRLEARPRDES